MTRSMNKTILAIAALCLITSTAFAALKPGDVAPTFSLRDLEGRDFYLSDVVGPQAKGKTNGVILSFFASWCVPCRMELPLLNSLTDELKARAVNVIIVDLKEDAEVISAMLKELKIDKPLALSDRYGKAAESYQVRFLPTTFFIGADGKVKDIVFGEISSERQLRESVGKILK